LSLPFSIFMQIPKKMPDTPSKSLFYFYEDLISGGISPIEEEYYLFRRPVEVGTVESPKTEWLYMEGLTPLTLPEFLLSVSKGGSREVLLNEELLLKDIPPPKIKAHLAKFYFDLDYYIGKLKKHPLTKGYPFFLADLEAIKADSLEKFKYFEDLANSIPKETNVESDQVENVAISHKIKWKANINVLSTLFFDLLNGQNGPPIIETTSKSLIDLIVNNFVDGDGMPLKRSTIETHFSTEKTHKRAKIGDRIEIGNVRLK